MDLTHWFVGALTLSAFGFLIYIELRSRRQRKRPDGGAKSAQE